MAGIEAILFDAYGTLFDLRSAVTPHAPRLGDRSDRVLAVWRQKQLEYTWTATLRDAYRPFDVITRAALDFALAAERIVDPTLADSLMSSFSSLEPYSDAEPSLRALAARGPRLGILSNGTPAMLARLLERPAFGGLLQPVLSVDSVKAFKPDARVYQSGTEALGLPRDRIGFVSSNAWDAAGAAGFGFRTFWINRAQQPVEYGLGDCAAMFPDLAALAKAI